MDEIRLHTLRDYYPDLYELAVINAKAQHGGHNDAYTVNRSFTWGPTEQGHQFWSYINADRFDLAKKHFPQYFEHDKNLKVTNNGLWIG